MEDKKCRICGLADIKNVNIFAGKNLLEKILTVFPIVIYKNDPLPKNICRKCVFNVTNMYTEIQRTMRIQNKWITNVRAIQPNHNYIRVLEMLETSNEVTKDSIKSTLGEEICSINIRNLYNVSSRDIATSQTTAGADSLINQMPGPISIRNVSSLRSDLISSSSSKVETKPSVSKIKEIQSKLELNGCTLVSVGGNKNNASNNSELLTTKRSDPQTALTLPQPSLPISSLSCPIPVAEIKEEPLDNLEIKIKEEMPDDDMIDTPCINSNIKCHYCPLEFHSKEMLATHQLIHMRLCLPSLFQKKYLQKSLRRGRLISLQDRRCIRCLNCWQVFADNKSILEHWALGECDFYCHICGKEFWFSPKILREHVNTEHGISYRSSKIPRTRMTSEIMKKALMTPVDNILNDLKILTTATEKEPSISESSSIEKHNLIDQPTISVSSLRNKITTKSTTTMPTAGLIKNSSKDAKFACNICNKSFLNIKARNSHMRAHKPAYAYGDIVLPPRDTVDVYIETDDYSYDDSNLAGSPKTYSKSPHGVRKKFVASRPTTVRKSKESNSLNSKSNKSTSNTSSAKAVIKVKSLVDLQQKSTENNSTEWPISQPVPATTISTASKSESRSVRRSANSETFNIPPISLGYDSAPFPSQNHSNRDKMKYDKIFNCYPCGGKFPSKLELFRHKRKCQANNQFTCEFCPKSFITSVDLQLHIMHLHKNST